jgi:hypothetical protein
MSEIIIAQMQTPVEAGKANDRIREKRRLFVSEMSKAMNLPSLPDAGQ